MHQSKIMTYRLDLFITPEGLRRTTRFVRNVICIYTHVSQNWIVMKMCIIRNSQTYYRIIVAVHLLISLNFQLCATFFFLDKRILNNYLQAWHCFIKPVHLLCQLVYFCSKMIFHYEIVLFSKIKRDKKQNTKTSS